MMGIERKTTDVGKIVKSSMTTYALENLLNAKKNQNTVQSAGIIFSSQTTNKNATTGTKKDALVVLFRKAGDALIKSDQAQSATTKKYMFIVETEDSNLSLMKPVMTGIE